PILKGEDRGTSDWAAKSNVIEAALFAKAAQVLGDLHDPRAEKPLIQKLKYANPMLDIKLFVRMRMADALGRMRSNDSVKELIALLPEEEATAREEYVRALVRIGSRDSLPALIKTAAIGSWDAREPAIDGIALLGDDRELAAFEKISKDEEALTNNECK